MKPETQRLERFFKPLASQMTTEAELEELRTFVLLNEEKLTKCTLGINQAIESAQINTQWHQKNFKSISRILKSFTA